MNWILNVIYKMKRNSHWITVCCVISFAFHLNASVAFVLADNTTKLDCIPKHFYNTHFHLKNVANTIIHNHSHNHSYTYTHTHKVDCIKPWFVHVEFQIVGHNPNNEYNIHVMAKNLKIECAKIYIYIFHSH